MREAPITIMEGENHCPGCGSEHLVFTTRVSPVFWALLIPGILFVPFTAAFSLVFPGAALLVREPRWRCEHCWRRGPVAAAHPVGFAWSHLRRH